MWEIGLIEFCQISPKSFYFCTKKQSVSIYQKEVESLIFKKKSNCGLKTQKRSE